MHASQGHALTRAFTVILVWLLGIAAVHAATLDILVDIDDNAGTGCSVSTSGGTFPGVEQKFTTTINTGVYPPVVTGVVAAFCDQNANTFGAPVPISAGGWPVGIGIGTGGYDVVETLFTTPTIYGRYRLGFVYTDPNTGSDTLFTTDGSVAGAPIILDRGPMPVIPTLAHGALLLLAFALAFFALRRLRQHRVSTLIIAGVLAAIVAGTALAAIMLDGAIGDWAGISPTATDPVDAPGGADIAAVYLSPDGGTVYVRVDVKTAAPSQFTSANATAFTVGIAGNFAITTFGIPPVSSIIESGALPTGVSFNYVAGQSIASLGGTPAAGTGGIYALTFTATNGVPPPGTQNFTLTVNEAPAITSAASTTCAIGVACTFTVTTSGFPAPSLARGGVALPAGMSFVDNGNGTGTLTGTPQPGSVGGYALTFTATNVAGSSPPQSFTLTVNKASTTTTLTASPNPSVFGEPVTFTATVTPQGTGVPTGSVVFTIDAVPQAPVALNASGVAALSLNSLAIGLHTVSAAYQGDANYLGSTSSPPLTQTVNKANASVAVALTTGVNPSVFGQPLTFTATVSAVPPGSGTPGGTVTFKDGAATLCPAVPLAAGQATCTVGTLSAGAHTITVDYSGDANFNIASSAGLGQTVNKADTTSTLALTGGTSVSVYGQSLTFTLTVTAVPPGGGTPTGPVTFNDGITPICAAVPLVAGIATCTTTLLPVGAHMISAVYGGDPVFNGSTSNTLGQTVNKADTTTTITNAAVLGMTPSVVGTPYAVTWSVTVNAPGSAATPLSGIVNVSDGTGDTCSAPVGAGTCDLTSNTPGSKQIVATYTGDANFNGSGSAAAPHTVNAPAIALPDFYTAVHDTMMGVSAPGVLSNDSGVPNPTVIAINGSAANIGVAVPTTAGGAVLALADGSFSYAPPNDFAGSDTFTYTASNSAGSSGPALVTINVTNVAPVVDLNGPDPATGIDFGPVTYTEGDAPVAIVAPTLTVVDQDAVVPTSIKSATVVITNRADGASEELSVTCGAGMICVFDPPSGTLTITGDDTPANYEIVLRSVEYRNLSANPTAAPQRVITFAVNDHIADNNPLAQATVDIVPVNTAPSITGPSTITAQLNVAFAFTGPNAVSVADPDAGTGDLVVTLTGTNGTISGLGSTAGLVVAPALPAAVVTLTGPLTNLNIALAGLTFTPTGVMGSALQIAVNDQGNTGSGGPKTANKLITVTFNNPPVLANGSTITYTENDLATVINNGLTVSDSDSPNLVGATVTISANFASGEDFLGFTPLGAITGVYNSGTGVLTLSGTDTLASYQTALRSVTYSNASENPSTAARTISFQVNDGAVTNNLSNVLTSTVNVTAVNDVPVLAGAATITYTENDPATVINGGITVTDVDSTNLNGATVSITANFAAAQDVLSFVNTATITGSYNSGTGVLTLTGTDTLAGYQAALRSVKYANSSENPSTSPRTVTFQVTDSSGGASNALTSTINVIAVNDAPVLANAGAGISYTENDAPTAISTTITVTDVDSTNLIGATVQITTNCSATQDVLSYAAALGITGLYTPGSCLLSLTGTTTVANYQTALRNVKYANSSENPSAATRTVSFQVDDGAPTSNLSNVVATTITVIPVNDAPTATPVSNLPAQAGIPISYPAGTLTATDPEGNTFTVDTTPNAVTNGTVTIAADGSFTFTPLPLATTASFQFRVVDNGTPTATSAYATVSFVVAGPPIFFVKNPAVGSANCTLGNECLLATAVTAMAGSPATPVNIFIADANSHDDGGGAIGLTFGSSIIGQGIGTAFDTFFGIVAPAQGTLAARPSTGQPFPTVTDQVAMSNNSKAQGFNIAVTGAKSGITSGMHTGLTIALGTVSTNNATATTTYAVSMQVSTGTFSFGNITASGIGANSNGVLFNASTSASTVTFGSITTAAGTALDVQSSGATNFTVGAVNATGGKALSVNNASGNFTFTSVTSTGGTNNVSLTNTNTGTLALGTGALSGATGDSFLVSGGTSTVTYGGTIASGSAHSVNITGKTGGSVTLSGAITDTDTGITLTTNTGATINFIGGISASTGTSPAFTATGGGTINVCDENPCDPAATGALVNTLTTTTGTALNVSSTTIGANNLEFRSIASNGAANAIVLNTTGATGSLVVKGNGGSCTGVGTCSGGSMQNSTNAAISLTSTRAPSFTRIAIQNAARSGIDGQGVTGFTLANSFIDNVGTGAAGQHEESNVAFNDGGVFTSASLTGTVSITNNTLTNARRHGIQIENGTGTIDSLTITGNTLTSSTNSAVSLGTGILVLPQGGAAATAHLTTGTISGNTITNFPSAEGIALLGGSGNSANNTSATLGAPGTPITISNNTIRGQAAVGQHMGSNAIRASMNSQVGVMNVNISCNGTTTGGCTATGPITNIEGQGISVFAGGTITGTATVTNNTIVANHTLGAGTQGLAVQVDDGPAGLGTSAANYNVAINNNSVSQYEGNGIRAIARASLGIMDVTINDNTVGVPLLANRNAIRVDSGSAIGDTALCLAMSGNTADGSGVNAGIGLRKQGTVAGTNEFAVVGLVPSPANAATTAAKVAGTNAGSVGGVDILSGDNFIACTQTP